MRVPGSVPALVVGAHDDRDLRLDVPADQRSPSIGCALICSALLGRQRAGLVEDPIVDEQLADVVQQRALDDGLARPLAEREPVRELVGARGDGDRMPIRVVLLAGAHRDETPRCLDWQR